MSCLAGLNNTYLSSVCIYKSLPPLYLHPHFPPIEQFFSRSAISVDLSKMPTNSVKFDGWVEARDRSIPLHPTTSPSQKSGSSTLLHTVHPTAIQLPRPASTARAAASFPASGLGVCIAESKRCWRRKSGKDTGWQLELSIAGHLVGNQVLITLCPQHWELMGYNTGKPQGSSSVQLLR